MKKMIMIVICLVLTAALMLPVLASEPKVVLVSGAKFATGSTVTVDIEAMTDMDARIYEAWLEGTVQYQWYSGNNPVAGATGVSYTIQSGDKTVKVQVTCGDLVLTSYSYMVANIVVGTKTSTTKAATTKESTTKAPTTAASATTAPAEDPGVMPINEPTTAPTTVPTTVSTTESTAAVPTTGPTASPTAAATNQASGDSQQGTVQPAPADEFPWWIVALAGVTAVIIAVTVIMNRKK